MNITDMTIEQIEERRAAIVTELDGENADLDKLEEEARALNAELERRKAEEAKRVEIRKAVANGGGTTIEKPAQEAKKMTLEEIRSSERYINAFADYIKSGDDRECRAILTETNPGSVSGSGPVPVPVMVEQTIKTAWENEAILSRVRKTNFRGNLKVAFERSADGAVVHTEGTSAPSEESLLLGLITLIPKNLKKYVRISDEALAMGGQAFLDYVYSEIVYQIMHKLSADVVTDIAGANTTHGSTYVGIPKLNEAPGVGTVVDALANLSDEARNPVVIMNRLTYPEFFDAMAAANFSIDPMRGLTVLYTSALPAYSTANDNAVYMIVGDLDGAQVNYPEGQGVVLKYDDLSEAEADMVKIVGRQYVAHGVTAPGRFVNVTKPAAVTT